MTIIRCEYEGEIYDLDVLAEQPIRVDISAIENDAIGEVFGASSQQFTLPGSKKNNRFFKHAYKVGVTNVPGLGESVRAFVITDSNVLLQGSLFLEEIVRTPIDGINYNVVIVNDVISFNESIKTVAVKDLNWNEYTHSLSVENITSSWDNGLFSGSVYYPLIDQGRDGLETTGSLPNVAIGESGSLGFMNNSLTPLKVQQFTPAIQVATVLELIFEQGGFTYSSSLQPLFEEIYILPKQTENLSVNGSGFSNFGFIASKDSDQTIPNGGSFTKITNTIETFDPTNSYNTTTSVYTVPTSGTYSFIANILFEVEPQDTNPAIEIRVRDTTNNITLGAIFFSPNEISGSETLTTLPVNLFINSTIELQAAYDQGGGTGSLDIFILSGSNFQTFDTPINYETGVVDLGEQFDPQTKCIDILKGLIEKFNLIIEPVYAENKVLKIETFNTWISSGKSQDYTQKVELAKRIGLKHPLSSQPKTLIFEDNKDNDKLSKLVIDGSDGFQWGTEVIDAVSDVPQGERKVGSFFAPVILESVPGSANSLIPQLYKTNDTQQERKTYKFKPRLGYKVSGSLDQVSFIGSQSDPFQEYATISNYDVLPIILDTTKNLHFNDILYPPTFLTGSVNTRNAFKEYWNDYITGLYGENNRILSLDLEFTPEEIQDIALNDKIFIEDNIYRINKISGYNLVSPDVVNVELIKIEEIIQSVAPNPTPTPTATTPIIAFEVGLRTIGVDNIFIPPAPIPFIQACSQILDIPLYVSVPTFNAIQIGTQVYTDLNGTVFNGENKLFGIGNGSFAVKVIGISTVGLVNFSASSCPTPTPTTSPIPTPTPTATTIIPTSTPTPTATTIVPTATPTVIPPTGTATPVVPTATATPVPPTPTPTPTATPLFFIFDACEIGGTTVFDELGVTPPLGVNQLFVDFSVQPEEFYTWNGNTANDTGGGPIVDLQPFFPAQTGCALPPTPTPTPTAQQLQAEIELCGGGQVWYVIFTNRSSLPTGFVIKSSHPNLTGNCWEITDANYPGPFDFTTTVDQEFTDCNSCLPTATPAPTGTPVPPTPTPTSTPVPDPTPTGTPTPSPQQLQAEIQLCGGETTYYVIITNKSSLPNGFVIESSHPNLVGSCWEIIDNNYPGPFDFTTTATAEYSSCASCVPPTATPLPTGTPTPLPPTATPTLTPTNTPSSTAVPPTGTPTPTDTPIPPTSTPVPPTATPIIPTATPTNSPTPTTSATPIPPTGTPIPTQTPIPPTATPVPPTATPVPPPTSTPVPPPTSTPVPDPTATPVPPTPVPPTGTPIPTQTPIPPTATPVPPTATPVPPTPIPPTETPFPTIPPVPTGTATPVPTGTPGPTLVPPVSNSILISSQDRSGPSAACNQLTPNLEVYFTGTLGNGTALYTDPELTVFFGGSGDYHKFGNNHRARVDVTVTAYGSC